MSCLLYGINLLYRLVRCFITQLSGFDLHEAVAVHQVPFFTKCVEEKRPRVGAWNNFPQTAKNLTYEIGCEQLLVLHRTCHGQICVNNFGRNFLFRWREKKKNKKTCQLAK